MKNRGYIYLSDVFLAVRSVLYLSALYVCCFLYVLDWTAWKWINRAGDTTVCFTSTMQTGLLSLAGCDHVLRPRLHGVNCGGSQPPCYVLFEIVQISLTNWWF